MLCVCCVSQECGAASCAIVALLDKQERRKVPLQPDYTGFVVRYSQTHRHYTAQKEKLRTLKSSLQSPQGRHVACMTLVCAVCA